MIWIVFVPLSFIGLLCGKPNIFFSTREDKLTTFCSTALIIKEYPLERLVRRDGEKTVAVPGEAPTETGEIVTGYKRMDTNPAAILMNAEVARQSIRTGEDLELERWVTAEECQGPIWETMYTIFNCQH